MSAQDTQPNVDLFGDMVGVINFLQPVMDAARRLEDAEEDLRVARREVVVHLSDFIATWPEQDSARIVNDLYWEWASFIPSKALADAVGLPIHQFLSKWIQPQEYEVTCPHCGQKSVSERTSRSSYCPVISACEECKANRENHWLAQEWKRERREEELRQLPYRDYLQTPEWKATRVSALRRHRYRCQLCNSPDRLEVHHRTYERLAQEHATDLIVLCADCHSRFHGVTR